MMLHARMLDGAITDCVTSTHAHYKDRCNAAEHMASAVPLPNLPEDPYHTPAQSNYPKQIFGKDKPVYCSVQGK